MKKRIRIKYLELDKFTYIVNDKIKIKYNHQLKEERCTWDEMWDKVRSHIKKIAEYEERMLKSNDGGKVETRL